MQVVRAADAIRAATGFYPCLFRAPYGNTSPAQTAQIRSLGMTTIQWDIDPRDWALPGVAATMRTTCSQHPRWRNRGNARRRRTASGDDRRAADDHHHAAKARLSVRDDHADAGIPLDLQVERRRGTITRLHLRRWPCQGATCRNGASRDDRFCDWGSRPGRLLCDIDASALPAQRERFATNPVVVPHPRTRRDDGGHRPGKRSRLSLGGTVLDDSAPRWRLLVLGQQEPGAARRSLLVLVRTGSEVGVDEGRCSPTRARARCACRLSRITPAGSTPATPAIAARRAAGVADHNSGRLGGEADTAGDGAKRPARRRNRNRRNPAAPTRCSRTRDRIGREPCSDSATGMSGGMPTSLQRAGSRGSDRPWWRHRRRGQRLRRLSARSGCGRAGRADAWRDAKAGVALAVTECVS